MSHSSQKSVIVIGAGFGGLSAAALLAKDGHRVTVLEKNSQPGGRAGQIKRDGFTFDMGPSWYMMPEVFDRFFAEFGKKPSDYYSIQPLHPQYRVVFGDGTHADITGDQKEDEALFESYEKGAAKKLRQYLREGELKYRIAMDSILYRNMDSIFDLANNWELIKNSPHVGVLEPMHRYVKKFFSHHKLQQIIEYNLVFLGCSPQNAPALFSMMGYVDMGLGVWYPEGGLFGVVKAMEQVAQEQGVEFVYNSPVTSLEVEDGRIHTVHCGDTKYTADYVVSNADYVHTEDLLSEQSLRTIPRKHWQKKTLTPSAFLLYLGVKGKLPKLQHHTLYFGTDWQKHFADVFDHPRWPQEPSVYINKTSATDPSVAPKGHENLMVLVPIAPGLEENDMWREHYANFILDFLEAKLDIKLKENIVVKEIFSITDFAERYNSYAGNALGGLAHTFFQSAIWRPANKSKKVANLLFSGANTVPGIGVPTSVISGHLVRDRLRM